MTSCQKIRPGATAYAGKQGFSYIEGISRESMGAQGLCMHLVTIPPGGRTRAHLHESHRQPSGRRIQGDSATRDSAADDDEVE